MDALFGEERANALRKELEDLTPDKRESMIVEKIAEALQEMGGKYVLPVYFKNGQGNRTSHYLIFVTKNVTAYTIMKGIMGGRNFKARARRAVIHILSCGQDHAGPVRTFAAAR